MKALTLGLICLLFISGCKNIQDEILPVGDVLILFDGLTLGTDEATVFLRFKELIGIQSRVSCLMLKFMKEDSFIECGYFTPYVDVPRFGEISWVQKMPLGNCGEADVLRIIIQLQTEYFKGFSVSKDFSLN